MNTSSRCRRIAAALVWAALLAPLSCGVASIEVVGRPPPADAGAPPKPDAGTIPVVPKELCRNGLDDDADGRVDEDCNCRAGKVRGCFSAAAAQAGVGVCREGTQACSVESELTNVWGPCTAEVLPGLEVCNGLDDNCDGQVDEGLQRTCASACGAGIEVCANGSYGACSAQLPVSEVCNGVDDDCDGQIDESITRACSSACGAGIEVCAGGAFGSCSARLPTAELCNGLDDDCDGQIDESLSRGCSSACGAGIEVCANGTFGSCSARLPTAELCNGLDDDCDGQIDESISRACSSACGSGVELCVNGTFGACSARVPAAEICNGLDDDCDGLVDESISRACSSACGAGIEVCANGSFGSCSARLPTAEFCNGIDDDCDGLVDESLSRTCSSACGTGLQLCSGGAYGSCSARQPVAEICGNQLDDDCDGIIDENCFCIGSPSQTPWQMHLGEAPMCWGTTFQTHGNTGEYAYASIPGEYAAGWTAHAAPAISFNDPSQMCGVCDCRAGGDFTYFQTSFDVPVGFNVQSLIVSILDVDDGVRVTVHNSTYPNGAVSVGSYAYLGGGSTSNLAALVAPGRNRIVLTHVDDCCAVRRIATATVAINGNALNPCP